MAMKTTIKAVGHSYLVEVHIDTAKVLEDGKPDPEWVSSWTWGMPPEGVEVPDYLSMCKREAELHAALDPRLRTPVEVELKW